MHDENNPDLGQISRVGGGVTKDVVPETLEYQVGSLGAGAVGEIRKALLRFSGSRKKRELMMALKEFYGSDRNLRKRLQGALEMHKALRRLPHGHEYTLPTLRATNKGLLMTDLSEGGRSLVMSSNDDMDSLVSKAKKIDRNNSGFVTDFLGKFDVFNLQVEDDPEMAAKWEIDFDSYANMMASETAGAGIKLEGDSIFFVLSSKRKYQLYIADLDNISFISNADYESLRSHNLMKILDMKPFIKLLWMELDT